MEGQAATLQWPRGDGDRCEAVSWCAPCRLFGTLSACPAELLPGKRRGTTDLPSRGRLRRRFNCDQCNRVAAQPAMSPFDQTNAPGSASVEVCLKPNSRELESCLPVCRTELWWSESDQYGSFPLSCWLLAGLCAKADILQLTRFRGYMLGAQTN